MIAIVWPVPEELDDCGAATQPVRASEVQLAVIEATAKNESMSMRSCRMVCPTVAVMP